MNTEERLNALAAFAHEILASLPQLREQFSPTPQHSREPRSPSLDIEHNVTLSCLPPLVSLTTLLTPQPHE